MDTNESITAARRPGHALRKRWMIGGASVLCAVALLGAASASANAADPGSSGMPAVAASHHPVSTQASPKHPAGKAAHKAGHALRAELATVIRNGKNAGDLAAARAITLVDTHPKFEAKLPAALQSDLKTLADAPASQRAADAAKIKTDALSGAYGAKIQKLAQNIQARITAHPAKVK